MILIDKFSREYFSKTMSSGQYISSFTNALRLKATSLFTKPHVKHLGFMKDTGIIFFLNLSGSFVITVETFN